jgi:hypothetical protein
MSEDMKTTKVRTCAECVAAGEHYIGTLEEFIDPKKSTPKCSLDGYMLFCVFQLGILDSSQVLRGGNAQIKWVDINDAQLIKRLPNGEQVPRTGPFILRINSLTAVQHYSLGTGSFKHDILTNGKNVYLPQNAPLYTWGDYLKNYLLAKNVSGEKRALSLGGTTVYPVVTDMMLAKLRNDTSYATHIPVYTPVLDQGVIERGQDLTQLDWLQAALQCLQQEETLTKGDVSDLEVITLPGESPSVVADTIGIAPSTSKSKEEVAAAAPPKSSFAAFAPPPDIK